ncbi:MAG TPA: hypothetical protein DCG30_00805 [Ruminococcus sp.]|nr:hypothetical protein [Ruminococcus sp.]
MEFILVIAVIFVLCKIFGVSDFYLYLGALGIVELAIIGMALLFIYFCIRLMFSKSKKAEFTHFDKRQSEKMPFTVAYYKIDDEEYPCVFPSEMVFTEKMYRKNKKCTVMYNKRMNAVFDIWAIITCLAGLVCSNLAVIATVYIFSEMLIE